MNETSVLPGTSGAMPRERAVGRSDDSGKTPSTPCKTLLHSYESRIRSGEYEEQQAQREAVLLLQEIADQLEANERKARSRLTGKILPFRRKHRLVPGLYLWGEVGRGKTWLMDQFYNAVDIENKLRLHFHRFMQRVHHELQEFSSEVDPLKVIALHMGKKYSLICLDEFQVTDIGDTMLLRNLVEALYAQGITLVITSNREPDELCQDWFQREQFQPAVDLIRGNSAVMHLEAPVDYRLLNSRLEDIFLTPHDDETERVLEDSFNAIASGEVVRNAELIINNRPVNAVMKAENAVWFDFDTLCRGPRATSDYIQIARLFPTVLLSDVPELNESLDSSARRFLNLVDELYDQRTRLIFSARTSLEKLYQGDTLAFEYQRVLSRLHEMQSPSYQRAR
ncbi:MAG: cell division protein ZapE [Sedimenticolaceae bacterium]|nr:cell division protein ZapE [Sedimenticolaceae bacterium]